MSQFVTKTWVDRLDQCGTLAVGDEVRISLGKAWEFVSPSVAERLAKSIDKAAIEDRTLEVMLDGETIELSPDIGEDLAGILRSAALEARNPICDEHGPYAPGDGCPDCARVQQRMDWEGD